MDINVLKGVLSEETFKKVQEETASLTAVEQFYT